MPSGNRINVELAFSANTSQVKAQLKDLETSLKNVIKLPGNPETIIGDLGIKEASKAAMELQQHLKNAMNVKTGNLDLSKLSTSFKNANTNLDAYYQKLNKAGTTGQQAFTNLARSIANAEAPTARMNEKMAKFVEQLKASAKWQISNTIIRGFSTNLQDAYRYAEDLNKSLNNIRIVTGQSVDQMAKFAKEANEAAKALNVTTTAYTDASLIFYQQGLSGDAVKERTETVLKLSNVTGDAAKDVSSYMTAIWNNYAKGADNLEHFADVITALGATTASSSAEIADGLEKFASIGETVGLSYEYATSALAAVVAKTRQSADVVGTAFKTLFARLQGLQLGDTLEDGVNLNKYSKALATVGVQVIDLNGNLRKADNILDETASKWDTLSKAQQTALAQTVAGNRQYAQFVALMESWDDVQANLNTARNSEGSLQEQADIYAESWEAARKRVKAAWQGVYDDLIDEDFFISLDDGLVKLIEGIQGVVKSLGGMQGIATTISSIFLQVFAKNIPTALDNLKTNFMIVTGQSKVLMDRLQKESQENLDKIIEDNPKMAESQKMELEGVSKITQMRRQLNLVSNQLTQQEKEQYENEIKTYELLHNQTIELQKQVELEEKKSEEEHKNFINSTDSIYSSNNAKNLLYLQEQRTTYKNEEDYVEAISGDINNVRQLFFANSVKEFNRFGEEANSLNFGKALSNDNVKTLFDIADKLKISFKEVERNIKKVIQDVYDLTKTEPALERYSSALGELRDKKDLTDSQRNELYAKQINQANSFFKENNIIGTDGRLLQFNIDPTELGTKKTDEEIRIYYKSIIDAIEKEYRNAQKLLEERTSALITGGIKTREEILNLENTNANYINAKAKLHDSKQGSEASNNFNPKATEKFSQTLSKTTGAAMSLNMAVNSVSNSIKVLGDESATSSQKVGALISAFSSSVYAVTSLISLGFPGALIAGLAAATVGLTMYAVKLKDAASTGYALKESKETLSKINEELDKSKQKLDDLNSSFESYNNLVDALDECTKGTEKWNEALENVNNQVLDLLKKYPELLSMEGAFDRNSDGMLEISKSAQGKLIELQQQNINRLNATSLYAQADVYQKGYNNSLNELGVNAVDKSTYGNVLTGLDHASKLITDASAIMPIAPSIRVIAENIKDIKEGDWNVGSLLKGTYIGDIIGTSSSLTDNIEKDTIDFINDHIDELTNLTEREFNEVLDSYNGEIDSSVIASLKKMQSDIDNLGDSLKAAKIASDNATRAMIESSVNLGTFGEDRDSGIGIASKLYNENIDDIKNELEQNFKGINRATRSGNDKLQTILKDYRTAVGDNSIDYADNAVSSEEGKLVYHFVDAYGNKLADLTQQQLIDEIAVSKAMNNLADTADDAAKALSKIKGIDNENLSAALLNYFATGDLNQLTEDQIDGLELSNEREFIKSLPEELQGNASELFKDLVNAQNQYIKQSEKITKNALNSTNDTLNNLDYKDKLTLTQKGSVVNALDQAYIYGGSSASDSLSNILKGLNADELKGFADAVEGIDWRTVDIDILTQRLSDAGIEVKNFNLELSNLVKELHEGAIQDIQELATSYAKLKKSISGLSDGDTIDKDAYDSLDKSMQSYFQEMEDGTYRLVGSATELKQVLDATSGTGAYLENIKNMQNQISGILHYSGDTINGTQRFNKDDNLNRFESVLGKREDIAKLKDSEDNWGVKDVLTYSKLIKEYNDTVSDTATSTEELAGSIALQQSMIAQSATSLNELQGFLEQGIILENQYQKALDNVTRTEAESYGFDYEEIIIQAEELAKVYNLDEKSARSLAIQNQRMNEGIKALATGMEGWAESLKKADNTSAEYAKTIREIGKAVVDLVGANKDLVLSSDFITTNMDQIQKAAKGDEDAINDLGLSVSAFQIEAMNFQKGMKGFEQGENGLIDTELNEGQFNRYKQTVIDGIDDLRNHLKDLKPGDEIDLSSMGDDWIEALNQMAYATDMSVEEMNSMLNSMGVDVPVGIETKTITQQVPKYRVDWIKDGNGLFDGHVEVSQDGTTPVDGTISVPHIGKDSKVIWNGNGSPSPSASKGSGSSSKPSKKDHEDPNKDVIDRYHDLNDAIQDVQHEMNILDKLQNKTAGATLIKHLKEQNELLEKQRDNYEALRQEQMKEAGELQGKLGTFGATFDENGEILNYADTWNQIKSIYDAKIAEYNLVVDQYNAMSKTEQDATGNTLIENAKNVLDAAKQDYTEAMKYLDRYDEVRNDIDETEEKILTELYKEIENNLKEFDITVKLDLDIDEALRKVNDFIKNVTNDFKKLYKTTAEWGKVFETAVKNANTYTSATGTINVDLDAIQKVKDIIDNPNYDYLSSNSMFGSRSEAIEKYKELEEQLMSDGEALYNLYESAWNDYLSAMDEALDQWDDLIDRFDDVEDMLDHYSKINELIYGGEDTQTGRAQLDQLYAASATNSLGKQSALATEIEALNKERAELLAAGSKETDEDIKKIDDAIKNANKNLTSEIESYVDTIQKQLSNSITMLMDSADRALTGGHTMNKVSERWNLAREAAEGYYDEVERVYQLETMETKWEDLRNSAKNIKNQQLITGLMDAQLTSLREKTKLSEYDIGLAEKELAIVQAQIALEEAQNNKNSMKLVRNEQGNWAYQYVADEEDTKDKEQDLLDANYEKYEYVKNASNEAIESVMELYETAQAKLTEIMEEYKIADEDRRLELQEEYDYFYDYYYGEDGLIMQKTTDAANMQRDLNEATYETLWALYSVDQENYALMTDNEKTLIDDMRSHSIESYADLLGKIATDEDSFYNSILNTCQIVTDDNRTQWENLAVGIIEQWYGDNNSVRNVIQQTYDDIMVKVAEYDLAIAESEQASGIAWTNIGLGIEGATALMEDNIIETERLKSEIETLSGYRQYVDEIANAWGGVIDKILQTIGTLKEYMNLQKEAGKENYDADVDINKVGDFVNNAAKIIGGTGGTGGNGGGNPSGNLPKEKDEKHKIDTQRYSIQSSAYGSGQEGLYDKDTGKYVAIGSEAIEKYLKSYNKDSYDKLKSEQNALSQRSYSPVLREILKENGDSKPLELREAFKEDSILPSIQELKDYEKEYTEEEIKEYEEYLEKNPSIAKALLLSSTKKFDTGGYTGEWSGGEGRMAMLHSKELVLNKEDTSNILSAVGAIREIANFSSDVTSTIAGGIASMIGTMLNIPTMGIGSSTSTTNNETSNVFNIQADFPNANSAEEIREALMSLPTLASQYLSRK